jgi:UDP-3-O-[3-hydroxymyristoyl] N-acetylglucosamine deacetylase / 3-hydroxyacyl-[acyl-carrier-protein] dehydratase
MSDRQKTLKSPVSFQGVGLHTGETHTIRLVPASADAGLVFVRTDLPGNPRIRVCPGNARTDRPDIRRTVLAAGGAEVHTVEHVLAAVSGLGIDNLTLEIDGLEAPEPPDGSARALVEAMRQAGVVELDAPRRFLEITRPVAYQDGAVQLVVLPHPGLRLSFTLQFNNPLIGTQHQSFEISPETFAREIAPARTFALWEDVEKLRQAGMIQGGSLQNALVVKGDTIMNEEGLRFPDEFVRHKILDLLGDLTLLGQPLRGHVMAVRSGHPSNIRFVREIAGAVERTDRFQDLLGQVQFDIADIERIMPHRYPLLLVDRILLLEDRKRVVGIKNVTINEPFFVGHFPGHPIMPAVLILEAMAQVGGILLLSTVDDPQSKLVYFMGIDKAKFRKPVLPGDQLVCELEMDKLKGAICRMKGTAYVRGELVAEAELLSKVVDR